jgi:hypothetical protein
MTLDALLVSEVMAGRALTNDGVQTVVSQHQPVIRPNSLRSAAVSKAEMLNSGYSFHFDGKDDLKASLNLAFNQLWSHPMQIRTADNSRWVKVTRQGDYTAIIHQQSGFDVPVGYSFDGNGNEATINQVIKEMGVGDNDRGDWVVSYGASDAVTSDNARFYWTQQQADNWLADPAEVRSPVTETVKRELLYIGELRTFYSSPEWSVDDPTRLSAARTALQDLGIEPDRINDESARQVLVNLREKTRLARRWSIDNGFSPSPQVGSLDSCLERRILVHRVPPSVTLTGLYGESQVAHWNELLIGGQPSLDDVLYSELNARRPLSIENIERAVLQNIPVILPGLMTDPHDYISKFPEYFLELRFRNAGELQLQLNAIFMDPSKHPGTRGGAMASQSVLLIGNTQLYYQWGIGEISARLI